MKKNYDERLKALEAQKESENALERMETIRNSAHYKALLESLKGLSPEEKGKLHRELRQRCRGFGSVG